MDEAAPETGNCVVEVEPARPVCSELLLDSLPVSQQALSEFVFRTVVELSAQVCLPSDAPESAFQTSDSFRLELTETDKTGVPGVKLWVVCDDVEQQRRAH